jgi:hypothetical protein
MKSAVFRLRAWCSHSTNATMSATGIEPMPTTRTAIFSRHIPHDARRKSLSCGFRSGYERVSRSFDPRQSRDWRESSRETASFIRAHQPAFLTAGEGSRSRFQSPASARRSQYIRISARSASTHCTKRVQRATTAW